MILREAIDKWKEETEAPKKKKADEKREVQRQKAARAAEEEAAKRKQAAEEEATRRKQAEEDARKQNELKELRERQMRAARQCDQLAANPTDPRKASEGVSYEALKSQAKEAVEACTQAVQQFPTEVRYQYQLGRAQQSIDRQKAFEIQKKVAAQRYPAAFDNLGWLYITQQRDYAEAVRQFQIGSQLDDPDCMVSLAEMIDRNHFTPADPFGTKVVLLKRAADLGHSGAMRAYSAEIEKSQRKLNEQEMQRQMLEIFGNIIQRIPQR